MDDRTLYANIERLAAFWRNDDHTRQCASRYNSGPCTCGYDSRLDEAITAVINALDEPDNPLTREETDDLMGKIGTAASTWVEDNNAVLALLKGKRA